MIVNACDPRFNPPIFDAAAATRRHLPRHGDAPLATPPRPSPTARCGKTLGADQLAARDGWAERGQLAIVGMGVEPGLSDVFARYAADHLFSRIDEIGVRDGSNLAIEG